MNCGLVGEGVACGLALRDRLVVDLAIVALGVRDKLGRVVVTPPSDISRGDSLVATNPNLDNTMLATCTTMLLLGLATCMSMRS